MTDENDDDRLLASHRRTAEVVLIASLAIGVGLVAAGTVWFNLSFEIRQPLQPTSFVAGVGLLVMATFVATQIKRYEDLFEAPEAWFDVARAGDRLRTVSFLTNLLMLLAAAILLVALMLRLDLLPSLLLPAEPVFRATTTLATALALAIAGTLHLSLRAPRSVAPPPFASVVTVAIGALAIALTTVGAVAMTVGIAAGPLSVARVDSPFLVLAGMATAATAVFVARSPPTLADVLAGRQQLYHDRSYVSRTRSILRPAATAIGMLFAVVFAAFVLGFGVTDFTREVPGNLALIALFGGVLLAMILSLVTAAALAGREEDFPLYQEAPPREKLLEWGLIGGSVAGAGVLFFLAARLMLGMGTFGLDPIYWVDLFALGVMVLVGPYGFYYAHKQRRIRAIEEHFPDFLRDIAANHEAGMTLTTAVTTASKGDYGMLSPEIQKFADQLSWTVPFDEAVRRFAERVRTPTVDRAASLVEEAHLTGGQVTDILLAAAQDARERKKLVDNRRSTMVLYTVIVYVTFLVFLAVAALLYGTFIPRILDAVAAVQGASSVGAVPGLTFTPRTLGDYRTFYFLAALVQAIGNGMIAGLLEDGRELSGLRHTFIMVGVTLAIFALLTV